MLCKSSTSTCIEVLQHIRGTFSNLINNEMGIQEATDKKHLIELHNSILQIVKLQEKKEAPPGCHTGLNATDPLHDSAEMVCGQYTDEVNCDAEARSSSKCHCWEARAPASTTAPAAADGLIRFKANKISRDIFKKPEMRYFEFNPIHETLKWYSEKDRTNPRNFLSRVSRIKQGDSKITFFGKSHIGNEEELVILTDETFTPPNVDDLVTHLQRSLRVTSQIAAEIKEGLLLYCCILSSQADNDNNSNTMTTLFNRCFTSINKFLKPDCVNEHKHYGSGPGRELIIRIFSLVGAMATIGMLALLFVLFLYAAYTQSGNFRSNIKNIILSYSSHIMENLSRFVLGSSYQAPIHRQTPLWGY